MAKRKSHAWQKRQKRIKHLKISEFGQILIELEKDTYKEIDTEVLKSGDYTVVNDIYKIIDTEILSEGFIFEDIHIDRIDKILKLDEISAAIEISKLRDEKSPLLFSETLTNHFAEIYKFLNNKECEKLLLENITNHPQSLVARNEYAEFLQDTGRSKEIIKAYNTINFEEIIPDREVFFEDNFYDACLYIAYYLTATKNKEKAVELLKIFDGTYYQKEASKLLRKNMTVGGLILAGLIGVVLFVVKLPFYLLFGIFKLITLPFRKRS